MPSAREEPPGTRASTTDSGKGGSFTRDSTTTNAASSTTASASATTDTGCPQEWVSEFEKPYTSANSPEVASAAPTRSIRGRPAGATFSISRSAPSAVGTAISRFTYRHQRQL